VSRNFPPPFFHGLNPWPPLGIPAYSAGHLAQRRVVPAGALRPALGGGPDNGKCTVKKSHGIPSLLDRVTEGAACPWDGPPGYLFGAAVCGAERRPVFFESRRHQPRSYQHPDKYHSMTPQSAPPKRSPQKSPPPPQLFVNHPFYNQLPCISNLRYPIAALRRPLLITAPGPMACRTPVASPSTPPILTKVDRPP